jgi:hypothetical protein
MTFDFGIGTFFSLGFSDFALEAMVFYLWIVLEDTNLSVLFVDCTGKEKSHHQSLFYPTIYLKFLGKFNFFSFFDKYNNASIKYSLKPQNKLSSNNIDTTTETHSHMIQHMPTHQCCWLLHKSTTPVI